MDLRNVLHLVALLCLITSARAIIGGEFVSPERQNEFNYIASIRQKDFDGQYYGQGFLCSGALISSKLVMTSAQCVYKYNSEG